MISVIIPAFNAQATIKDTISSIQNQKYQALQLVIVDDGSTDDTWSIVTELATTDSRILVIHTNNQGVAAARLTGLFYAKGDYISFVDSDDIVLPDMYYRLAGMIEKAKPEIVSFGYIRRFVSGNEKEFPNQAIGVLGRDEALIKLIAGEITPSLWDKLFSKALFEDIANIQDCFCDIKINEDLLMNFYLFSKASSCLAITDSLYVWIERKNSATRQPLNSHKIYDSIKVKQYILNHIDDRLYQYAKARYISTLINTYGNVALDNALLHIEDLRIIRKRLIESYDLKCLSSKKKIQSVMIRYTPKLYQALFRLYRKHCDYRSFTEN